MKRHSFWAEVANHRGAEDAVQTPSPYSPHQRIWRLELSLSRRRFLPLPQYKFVATPLPCRVDRGDGAVVRVHLASYRCSD